MQETERIISLYHMGYLICLTLGLLTFGIAAFMFFKFEIRHIFSARSGRGLRRTVKEMQKLNRQQKPLIKSGELRLTEQLAEQTETMTELLPNSVPEVEAETELLEETPKVRFRIRKSIIITNAENRSKKV